MDSLTIFAATATDDADLVTVLGLDWRLLVVQAVGFLLLAFVLAKLVYPALMRAIDNRRDQLETSMKDAKAAEEKLAKAEDKIAAMLSDARKEADGILARTGAEANTVIADAEEKAKARAEQIVADAHTQLEADVRAARQALKKDTIELVALATEKIVRQKVDPQADAKLIAKAIEERS